MAQTEVSTISPSPVSSVKKLLEMPSARIWWAGLILIVIFGMLESLAYFKADLSIDEPSTANVVHLSWADMYATFPHDHNTPLSYWALKVWVSAFGETPAAMRSLSAIYFGLSILLIGVFTRKLIDPFAGWAAALLLTTSTFVAVIPGATVGRYAPLLLLCVASTGLLLYMVFTPPKRLTLALVAFAIVNCLGLLTHTIYAFYMAGLVAAAIWGSRRTLILVIVSCVVSGIVFLLLWGSVLTSSLNLATTTWLSPDPGPPVLFDSFSALFGGRASLLLWGFVALLVIVRFRVTRTLITNRFLLATVTLILVACFVPFAASYVRAVFHSIRTTTTFLPAVAILVAFLLRRLSDVRLGAVVIVGFAAISLVTSFRAYQASSAPAPRDTIRFVADNATCGDTLVMSGLLYAEVAYYMRQYQLPDCITLETFPADTITHPAWIDVPDLVAKPEALTAEAAASAERLAAQKGRKIWYFDATGYEAPTSVVMKDTLDHTLKLDSQMPIAGSGDDAVYVYGT